MKQAHAAEHDLAPLHCRVEEIDAHSPVVWPGAPLNEGLDHCRTPLRLQTLAGTLQSREADMNATWCKFEQNLAIKEPGSGKKDAARAAKGKGSELEVMVDAREARGGSGALLHENSRHC